MERGKRIKNNSRTARKMLDLPFAFFVIPQIISNNECRISFTRLSSGMPNDYLGNLTAIPETQTQNDVKKSLFSSPFSDLKLPGPPKKYDTPGFKVNAPDFKGLKSPLKSFKPPSSIEFKTPNIIPVNNNINDRDNDWKMRNPVEDIIDKATNSMRDLTGQSSIKYGELSKFFQQEKTAQSQPYFQTTSPPPPMTGPRSFSVVTIRQQYKEVWQASKSLDDKIKTKLQSFISRTGNDTSEITKSIIRKIAKGEYDVSDLTFLLRILIALGADLTPIFGFLPMGILSELVGIGITLELSERFVKTVSVELEKRFDNKNKGDKDEQQQQQTQSLPYGPPSLSSPQDGPSSLTTSYSPGDLTKQTFSGLDGAAGQRDQNSSLDLSVLNELEECLQMEKELLMKLDKIKSAAKS